jgi:hypothetical protein
LAPGDLGAAEGSRREPLRILARSLIGEDDSLHRGDGPRLRLAVRLERRAGDDDVGDPPTLVGIEADRVGTRIPNDGSGHEHTVRRGQFELQIQATVIADRGRGAFRGAA